MSDDTDKEVNRLHTKAMDLAEDATIAKRKGSEKESVKLFEEALILEKKAALHLPPNPKSEPTRSILYRSAASIAYHLKDREAMYILAKEGLRGHPPNEIKLELEALRDDSGVEGLECRCCGKDENEVEMATADDICEDCLCDYYVYCSVCEEYHATDSVCGHLYWCGVYGEWLGVGGEATPEYIDVIKESFMVLLSKTGIVEALRDAITTWQTETDPLYGLPCYIDTVYNSSYKFDDDFTEEQEEAMSNGEAWLMGLDGDTSEANKQTLEWINEWLNQKGEQDNDNVTATNKVSN